MKRTRAGYNPGTLARTVERLIWAAPQPTLKGVSWADSLCGYCSVTAVSRAVNDDVSFLLPWIVGVGWAGSRAALWSRTLQVVGALSGTVARAESPSEVLVHMELSIGVPLLTVLLGATVHLSMSPQLLLKLLNC